MKKAAVLAVAVLAILGTGELLARHYVSGSLDCLEPSPDRELLYVLKPGSYETDGWFQRTPWSHITVGDDGCRRTTRAPRPGAPPDALFLGDSMAFGLGVNDDQSLPALLERKLPGELHFANCAVPGYNLGQVIRAADLRLEEKRPRLLVLVIHPADLETPVDFSALAPHNEATRFAINHSRLARLVYILARIHAVQSQRAGQSDYLSAEQIDAALARLVTAARAADSAILVLELGVVQHPSLVFDDMLTAHGLAYFHLEQPRDHLPDGEHWTAAGTRTVADQVAPLIAPRLQRLTAPPGDTVVHTDAREGS